MCICVFCPLWTTSRHSSSSFNALHLEQKFCPRKLPRASSCAAKIQLIECPRRHPDRHFRPANLVASLLLVDTAVGDELIVFPLYRMFYMHQAHSKSTRRCEHVFSTGAAVAPSGGAGVPGAAAAVDTTLSATAWSSWSFSGSVTPPKISVRMEHTLPPGELHS